MGKLLVKSGLCCTVFAICSSLTVFVPVNAAPATSVDEQRALELVRLYSEAWRRRDAAAVAAISHPILAIREGGVDKYRASLDRHFAVVKDRDFDHSVELIGTPSEELILGRSRMIGVPAIRKTPGFATTPFVYVVVSYDEGRTWTILSLGCTDERWLKALVPGYQGTPDILGMGNPVVSKMINEDTIDEDVFLRGPRYSR